MARPETVKRLTTQGRAHRTSPASWGFSLLAACMLITDDEETLVVNYKKKHRSLIFSEKQKKVLSFWEKKYDPYPDVKPEKKQGSPRCLFFWHFICELGPDFSLFLCFHAFVAFDFWSHHIAWIFGVSLNKN